MGLTSHVQAEPCCFPLMKGQPSGLASPRSCYRLLQAWTPHSDDEAGSDEELSLQMQPGGGQWLTGRQVAEITLDRQLLQHILEAGAQQGLRVWPLLQ